MNAFGAMPPAEELEQLHLITLYLTDRCNSRCVTCDYWRHGRDNLTLEGVRRLLPDLVSLKTRVALFSGGEPLLNPQWRDIAALVAAHGMKPWLLTSGLSLAKHAAEAAKHFDSITVSLDGTNAATYQAIRGLDAFDKVCAGIRSVAAAGAAVGIRVTVQRANYLELPHFVSLAHELGARQVSFLAVDVSNPHAFARTDAFADTLALTKSDLPILEALLRDMNLSYATDFASGFIAESPVKLRRLHQYFAALHGEDVFPLKRCNAPEFSAVVGVDGRVSPCFFIPGPEVAEVGLRAALNAGEMRALRADIRAGRRPECLRCVCPKWREHERLAVESLRLPRGSVA